MASITFLLDIATWEKFLYVYDKECVLSDFFSKWSTHNFTNGVGATPSYKNIILFTWDSLT